jgi:benzylsuccinate CoA-transferase BbsF subunit
MAVLIHRKLTGEGQYIDQAQAESALHFLTVPLIDSAAHGRVYNPVANYDPGGAPHGVYPTAGDDRWVAIACQSDAQWQSLCRQIGKPELAQDRRFQTLAGRQSDRAALDEAIGAWTRNLQPAEVERQLQEAGIPAHAVENTFDTVEDLQLAHRRHFVGVRHGAYQESWVENSRFSLSRTPAQVTRSGPTLGEYNEYVLTELLGYSEERVSELALAEVFG